jgi:hypothetical protein
MASMPGCACPTHRVEICEVWRGDAISAGLRLCKPTRYA